MSELRVEPELLAGAAVKLRATASAVEDIRDDVAELPDIVAFPYSNATEAYIEMVKLWKKALDHNVASLEAFAFNTDRAADAYRRVGDKAVQVVITPFGGGFS